MYVYSHLITDLKLELNGKSFVIQGKNKHLLDVKEPRFTELPEEVVLGLFQKYHYLHDIKNGTIFYEKDLKSAKSHARDLEEIKVNDAPIQDEQLETKKTVKKTTKKTPEKHFEE